MLIYNPISPTYVTQEFGENNACVKVDIEGRISRPMRIIGKVKGNVCPVGYKELYPLLGLEAHNGTDIIAYHNQPCYFPIMAETEWYCKEANDVDGGIGVDVFSKKRIHVPYLPEEAGTQARREWQENGEKLLVKYRVWHLLSGRVDEDVAPGELIGYCDNTGASGGDHAHVALKFVDETGKVLDRDNGYYGCVSMNLWRVDKFILDSLYRKQVLTRTQQISSVFLAFQIIIKDFKILVQRLMGTFQKQRSGD